MTQRAPVSDQTRSRRRAAAHLSWAYTPDRAARTAPARAALADRFEKLVDPEGTLDAEERAKRAASLRKCYFTQLGLRSGAARRAKRAS